MTFVYETPEEAALSGWATEWQAYVVETRYESDDLAKVLVDTEPSHPMLVTCERRGGRWGDVFDQSKINPNGSNSRSMHLPYLHLRGAP